MSDPKNGCPYPMGATVRLDGTNFSIFSATGTSMELVFFGHLDDSPAARSITSILSEIARAVCLDGRNISGAREQKRHIDRHPREDGLFDRWQSTTYSWPDQTGTNK